MNRYLSPFLFTLLLSSSLRAETVPESLRRSRGQTKFRNVGAQNYAFAQRGFGLESATLESAMPMAMAASADGGTAKRDVAESDVFSFQKDGTLFLLNNARGLQAIGVDDQGAQLDLLSRAKVPGENLRDMYRVENRILVLSSYLVDPNGDRWKTASRISVFDISNPKRIVWEQDLDMQGDIADSRMVGDVLYVATQGKVVDRYNRNEQKNVGTVQSFKIPKTGEVTAVKSHNFSLQVSGRENMSIHQEKVGENSYKYYLAAVLQTNRWGGWWESTSQVELVDITDPNGEIKPVMVASVQGYVKQRQQIYLEKGSLYVASNSYFNADGSLAQNRWGQGIVGRVSVERFDLPTKSTKAISEKDRDNREGYLAVQGQVEIDAAKAQLNGTSLSDGMKAAILTKLDKGPNGLHGKFVQVGQTLHKLRADSQVSSGSTRGESADLREVRFVDDLVLASWVPANLVDPFDIFQRTDKGLKYRGRLEFDGWIEKKFIQKVDGRLFAIGLGWVQNATQNWWSRKLQIKLFEVVEQTPGKGDFKALDLSTLVIQDKNLFASLDSLDKYFTLSIENGKGYMMFQASGQGESGYRSGAKVIGVDITKALGNPTKGDVFTDHPMMSVDKYTLKRVFESPGKYAMTFSNSQLGLFDRQLTKLEGTSEKRQTFIVTLKEENEAALEALLAQHPRVKILSQVGTLVEVSVPADYAEIAQVLESDLVESSEEGTTFVESATVEGKATVLELSRNITSFFYLGNGGIQVIAPTEYYGYQEYPGTDLRYVPHADAELKEARSLLTIPGRLLAMKRLSDGRLLVLSKQKQEIEAREPAVEGDEELEAPSQYNISYVSVADGKLVVNSQMNFNPPQDEMTPVNIGGPRLGFGRGRHHYYGGESTILDIDTNRLLLKVDGFPMILDTRPTIASESPIRPLLKEAGKIPADEATGKPEMSNSYDYKVFDGQIWAYWTEIDQELGAEINGPDETPAEPNEDGPAVSTSPLPAALARAVRRPRPRSYGDLTVSAHYIARVAADGSIGTKINIPGEPISVSKEGLILVKDVELMDLKGKSQNNGYFEQLNREVVIALKIEGDKAVLTDLRDENPNASFRRQAGTQQVSIRQENNSYGYGYETSYGTAQLDTISVNAKGELEEQRLFIRNLTLGGSNQLLDIIADESEAGRYLALLSNGRRVQVVTWTVTKPEPEVVNVQMVNEHQELALLSDTISVPYSFSFYSYSWDSKDGKITYNPLTRRLAFAANNAGVCEAFLLTDPDALKAAQDEARRVADAKAQQEQPPNPRGPVSPVFQPSALE